MASIDYAALKAEIALPAYAALAAVGNDTGLCAALNAPDGGKSVRLPTVEWWTVAVWFAGNGRYLKVQTASEYSGSDPSALGIKSAALTALRLFATFNAKDPFDTAEPNLQALFSAFATAGVLSSDDKAAFDALNLRGPASRAEELFGAGVVVTESDIVKARSA